MKPNTARLRLWANALLSGKYYQGKGQLKTKSGAYCCLGVACEVSGKWFDGEWGLEPAEVTMWYGAWASSNGYGRLSDLPRALAARDAQELTDLNDQEDWTFPEIAGLIYDYCEAVDTGAL